MSALGPLPEGRLVAFYGDDFTGSSAVMEILTAAGLPTVLFLDPPTGADLQKFRGYRGIGIAGVARSQSPEWMNRELPPIFSALKNLHASIIHYKTCSTLDSSPSIGSIGRAIDIAVPILTSGAGFAPWQPLIIAAPPIGRYQAFGHLFASYAGRNYRLDRHPVMNRHPVTPMNESDVARHIGYQTHRKIGLVDVDAVKSGFGTAELDRQVASGHDLVSIDVIDDETMVWAGRAIWTRRAKGMFAVGSQGVEYALTAYWRSEGMLAEVGKRSPASAVDQIIVASGSVSPVTETQIAWASREGFAVIPINPRKALDERAWREEIENSIDRAKLLLSEGRSPILATALGPDDPSVAEARAAIAAAEQSREDFSARVGAGLGEATLRLLEVTGLKRVVIAGGDTSGFATRALGIRALTAFAPLSPGSPLCLGYADNVPGDGLEIALKGGQMGAADYFGKVRAGGAFT